MKLRAKGGVSITAGHNDIEWNALTFINREGTYLNPFQGAEVLDFYHLEKFRKAQWRRSAKSWMEPPGRLCQALGVPRLEAMKASFGSSSTPATGRERGSSSECCRALRCELIPVNTEPNGFFPHDPEPRPRNAQQVSAIVKVVGRPGRVPPQQRRQPHLARLRGRPKASPRNSRFP